MIGHDRRLLSDAFFLQEVQLSLDLVDAVFPVSEEVEPFRPALQELPAELGPDAPARPGDQHPLPPDVGEAFAEVYSNRAAREEILGIDLPGLDEVRLPVQDLGDAGDDPDPGELRATQDGVDPRKLLPGRAGNGDDRLVGGGRPDHAGRRLDRSEHGDVVDARADLGRNRRRETRPRGRISALPGSPRRWWSR